MLAAILRDARKGRAPQDDGRVCCCVPRTQRGAPLSRTNEPSNDTLLVALDHVAVQEDEQQAGIHKQAEKKRQQRTPGHDAELRIIALRLDQ